MFSGVQRNGFAAADDLGEHSDIKEEENAKGCI